MQIKNSTYNQNINFKAGLSPKIRRGINSVNIKELEKVFLEFGVKCDFKKDKPVAGAMALAINVLQEAYEKYSLPFYYLPPSIKICSKDEYISGEDAKSFGFCVWGNTSVIKNEEECDLGAIFINELPHNNDIKFFDERADVDFKKRYLSTDHFLGYFLHELFHNIHLNLLLDKYGLDACSNANGEVYKFLGKQMSIRDKLMATMTIGKYASKTYAELFAEIMTRLTVESLGFDDLKLKSNPMDNLKKIPSSLQKFIKKELE